MREIRLWIGQIAVPVVTGLAIIFPEKTKALVAKIRELPSKLRK
jgi:hypothetical protein